ITRKEADLGEGEWVGVGEIEQEEKMGRKLGIFAQEEKKGERRVGVEDDSVTRRQQQQQEDEVVEDEVSKGNNVDRPVIDLPLCQNAGCFCHFPVVPQHPQQRQRQGETSQDEREIAVTSHDHVDGLDEDETDDDDDDAFTIILDSDPPSLSSSSSSSSHDIESPNNLTPPEGDETPLCQNADCFCHFPVVVRPNLPRSGQTGQRHREQTAQNEDRRLIVPDHVDDAGGKNATEIENEDEEDAEEAFTIVLESSSPPPPPSSPRAESPEDLASVEGSQITLSEWELDSEDFDSNSDSDSDSEGLDERIHV
ncbi:hypothetical protein KC315_g19920, partial [Hortaea werneckii]